VLGVLPGIIGSLQALETIKLLLGKGSPLVGRLAIFDALTFRWRELRIRKNENCPACGTTPTITGLIDYDEFCGVKPAMSEASSGEVPELTPEQLKQRIDTGEPLTLLDVREAFEWDIANLAASGATLVPLGDLADRMGELDPDADVVVYCRTGGRSLAAARHLRAHGFTRVWNLKGGINGWAAEVDPELPTY
jgi:adenylyltransferase/sulfurtransferase